MPHDQDIDLGIWVNIGSGNDITKTNIDFSFVMIYMAFTW